MELTRGLVKDRSSVRRLPMLGSHKIPIWNFFAMPFGWARQIARVKNFSGAVRENDESRNHPELCSADFVERYGTSGVPVLVKLENPKVAILRDGHFACTFCFEEALTRSFSIQTGADRPPINCVIQRIGIPQSAKRQPRSCLRG
jgi:hypothetical protein